MEIKVGVNSNNRTFLFKNRDPLLDGSGDYLYEGYIPLMHGITPYQASLKRTHYYEIIRSPI